MQMLEASPGHLYLLVSATFCSRGRLIEPSSFVSTLGVFYGFVKQGEKKQTAPKT